MDEFVELKKLVENLRASLPPCREDQYQLIGLYLLAALRLGKGDNKFHRCIDAFFTEDAPHPWKRRARLKAVE